MKPSPRSLNLIVFSGCLAVAAGAADTAPPVSVERLSDRVAVVTVPGAQSTNVIALRSTAGVVVVDSEVTPTFSALIRKRIEQEFETDRFFCLINTHGHGDHCNGNQAFADVPIVGHRNVGPALRSGEARREETVARLGKIVATLNGRLAGLDPGSSQAAALREKISYYGSVRSGLGDGFVLTPPTIELDDAMTLRLGDLTLELEWFGTAHSDSDIVIHCPEEHLLLTGDLFVPDGDLYVDSERVPQLARWIEQLERMEAWSGSLTAIVPGHGPLLPRTVLDRELAFAREQRRKYEGRTSGFLVVRDAWEKLGIEAGLRLLRELKGRPEEYYLFHAELDSYAYRLMLEDQVGDALRIFTALAELYPDSDVAFDSLGEARIRTGEPELAAASFRRALELNPENRNAAAKLASLSGS